MTSDRDPRGYLPRKAAAAEAEAVVEAVAVEAEGDSVSSSRKVRYTARAVNLRGGTTRPAAHADAEASAVSRDRSMHPGVYTEAEAVAPEPDSASADRAQRDAAARGRAARNAAARDATLRGGAVGQAVEVEVDDLATSRERFAVPRQAVRVEAEAVSSSTPPRNPARGYVVSRGVPRKLTYQVPNTDERYSANTVAGAKVAVKAATSAGTLIKVPDRIKRIATAERIPD